MLVYIKLNQRKKGPPINKADPRQHLSLNTEDRANNFYFLLLLDLGFLPKIGEPCMTVGCDNVDVV